MTDGLTKSEKFVAGLCERAFLRLWSHPNPIGKKGKELCDCLVVCGPHIVIISVKDIEFKESGNLTGYNRWIRSAIEKSVDQIFGAERWLEGVSKVTRSDGRVIALPPNEVRKYYRISVSLGGKKRIPIRWGELKSGFVHVCDEDSVGILFSVLDTITDFTDFLSASEDFFADVKAVIFDGGGIEDLLGLYLSEGRTFERIKRECPGILVIDNDYWAGFSQSQEFKNMRREFSRSLIWDELINYLTSDLLTDNFVDQDDGEVTRNDLALTEMALLPRWSRVQFAEKLKQLLSPEGQKVRASILRGENKTVFVLMIASSDDRKARTEELRNRSLVARGRLSSCETVIGIATDEAGSSKEGYSHDIIYLHIPEWTDEMDDLVTLIQKEFGYFSALET